MTSEIFVLSDTHLRFPDKRLQDFLNHIPADAPLIHCGDFGDTSVVQYLSSHKKFIPVRGNCDNFPDAHELPALRTVTISGLTIGIVHGAGCNVPAQFEQIFKTPPDIVLFGHTHVRFSSRINSTFLCNPGSFSLPRDGNPPSFAKIVLRPTVEIIWESILPPAPATSSR